MNAQTNKTRVVLEVVGDVRDHLSHVGDTETGDRIPADGSVETLARGSATILSTEVITGGDIAEGGGLGGEHGVEQRVEETQGLARLGA